MNGIIFKLFKSFIVENYDYVGWNKIQEIFLMKLNGGFGSYNEFYTLVQMAKDILREDDQEILKKFGQFCFLYLLENSLLERPKNGELADVFFYSDPLLNLKVKKLNNIEKLGWEIDGQLKVSEELRSEDGKSLFYSFFRGFLNEGDKYYNNEVSVENLDNSQLISDSCKITVFVNNAS